MIQQSLDAYASQAGDRYIEFLNALRNILWSAMQRDPLDMRVRDEVIQNATARAQVYRDAELTLLAEAVDTVAENAQERVLEDLGVRPTGDADIAILEQYREQIIQYAATEITSQLQRDIAQVGQHQQQFGLEVYQEALKIGSPGMAHARVLMNKRARFGFYFRDRIGRKHNSSKFIRTTIRHTLLTLWVNSFATLAAQYAADHMTVEHPDNAKFSGMVLGFVQSGSHPTLTEVADEIFHPNSVATLKAHS